MWLSTLSLWGEASSSGIFNLVAVCIIFWIISALPTRLQAALNCFLPTQGSRIGPLTNCKFKHTITNSWQMVVGNSIDGWNGLVEYGSMAFDGTIDDIGLWNRALDTCEILNLGPGVTLWSEMSITRYGYIGFLEWLSRQLMSCHAMYRSGVTPPVYISECHGLVSGKIYSYRNGLDWGLRDRDGLIWWKKFWFDLVILLKHK